MYASVDLLVIKHFVCDAWCTRYSVSKETWRMWMWIARSSRIAKRGLMSSRKKLLAWFRIGVGLGVFCDAICTYWTITVPLRITAPRLPRKEMLSIIIFNTLSGMDRVRSNCNWQWVDHQRALCLTSPIGNTLVQIILLFSVPVWYEPVSERWCVVLSLRLGHQQQRSYRLCIETV